MTASAVSPAWYAGRGAVRVDVDCEGATHHVTWRRGRLVVEDHDIAAERALRGLEGIGGRGATKPRCLQILDTWRDLNSRPALAELSRLLWGRPAPRIPNTDEGLPAPLGQVAALATVVRCERRWADPGFAGHDRRVVSQEVAECFGAAIQQTLAVGREGRRPLRVRSRCEVLPPGEPASITIEVRAATGEVRLDAEIPITWLVDIWGRAAAAVDGRLVVEAEAVAIDRMAVAAIDWGLDGSLTKVDPHLTSAWVVRQGTGWHIDAASAAPRLTRQPWCSVDAMARGR